jgi:hypothetical protein
VSIALISTPRDVRKPSAELRRIQESLRALVRQDQENAELACSVWEGMRRIDSQIDRLAGLQELWEWYSKMPAL